LGSGQHVDQHRRHRHDHADRHDLQRPTLEPARQAPRPHLEERERSRRRQAEDAGAEEECGRRVLPPVQQQERDDGRHRERNGNAPRRLRDYAGRSRGRRHFGHVTEDTYRRTVACEQCRLRRRADSRGRMGLQRGRDCCQWPSRVPSRRIQRSANTATRMAAAMLMTRTGLSDRGHDAGSPSSGGGDCFASALELTDSEGRSPAAIDACGWTPEPEDPCMPCGRGD